MTQKIFVALENLRSLYNIGAIYRTSEFLGIEKVVLIGYSGIDRRLGEQEIHQRLKKTSLGTIEKVGTDYFQSISLMKEKYPDFKIIGIENNISNTKNIFEWNIPNQDLIIVFGNEIDGLSKEAIKLCDEIIEIPRYGTHSSLNVTTACGIVLGIIKKHNV